VRRIDGLDRAQVFAAEAGEQRRFLDRAVTLRRRVDHERRRLGLKSAARGTVAGRAFARADQGDEAGSRRGVVDYAAPARRQAEHLPEPVSRQFLDLGQRGARRPVEPELRETGAREVAEDRREQAVRREVRKETRVLEMTQCRQDQPVEVRHDRVERLRALGRCRGQRSAQRAMGLRRQRGIVPGVHALAKVRDPVDELMTTAAEFIGGHWCDGMSSVGIDTS
jgi:hypothetical protein